MEPLWLTFWNISEKIESIFYILASIVAIAFILGVWARTAVWTKGEDEEDSVLKGLGVDGLIKFSFFKLFSRDCIFAKKSFAISRIRGIMLLLIIWGTFFVAFGFLVVILESIFNLNILTRYFRAYSLTMDVFGGFLLIGTLIALIRRYIIKPEHLVTSMEDGAILWLLFFNLLFGFIMEGIRLSLLGATTHQLWSPVGYAFSYFFNALYGTEALQKMHFYSWALHISTAFLFIMYIPYSKMFHLFAAQITTSIASDRYGG